MTAQTPKPTSETSLRSAIALDVILKIIYVFLILVCVCTFGLLIIGLVYPALGTQHFSELYDSTPKSLVLLVHLAVLVMHLVALLIVSQLRKISSTLTHGDPFVPENAQRLRRIWIYVALGEGFRTLLVIATILFALNMGDTALERSWVTNFAGISPDGSVKLPFRLTVWFFVLVIIVLEQIFRIGARMREDQQFTV